MDKDINRIKVVLAEKKEQTNGWPNNSVAHPLQFLSGVPMLASLRWRRILKLQNYSMLN